jgi:arginine exporter protein ArgO
MSRFRRSDITLIVIGVLGVAFGVYVNPFLTTWWDQHQAIHGIVTLLVLAAVSLEVVRSLRCLVSGSL